METNNKLRKALMQVKELNDLWFDTFTLPDGATSIHSRNIMALGNCSWEFTLGDDLFTCPIAYARVNMYMVSDRRGLRKRVRDAKARREEAGI